MGATYHFVTLSEQVDYHRSFSAADRSSLSERPRSAEQQHRPASQCGKVICGTHLARRRFVFMAITYFRHRGTAVARALVKSACQVSRLLTTQTQACAHDPGETTFIDETVARLLLEGASRDQD